MVDALDPRRASVLVVEDNPDDVAVIARVLENFGIRELYAVETGEAALDFLKGRACDVVFVDYNLPRMNGITLLERLLALRSGLRVIVITGAADERVAVAALKAGAVDYLPKDELLTSSIIRSLQIALRQEIEEAERERASPPPEIAGLLDAAIRDARWLLESAGAPAGVRDNPADALAALYGAEAARDLDDAFVRYLRDCARRFPESAAAERDALVRMLLATGLSPVEMLAAYQASLRSLQVAGAQLPCHPATLLCRLLAAAVEAYQRDQSIARLREAA